jgi:hypothetical protein
LSLMAEIRGARVLLRHSETVETTATTLPRLFVIGCRPFPISLKSLDSSYDPSLM